MILKLVVTLIASIGLFFCSTVPAEALGNIDVNIPVDYSSTTGFSNTAKVGQSFNAGASGYLDRIEFTAKRQGACGDVIVSIFSTVSGIPSGVPLTTHVIPEASISTGFQVFTVDFLQPATLSVGTEYAVTFELATVSSTGQFIVSATTQQISGSNALAYGGNWFVINQGDPLSIKTYVTTIPAVVNSPSTPTLAETGNTFPNEILWTAVISILSGLGISIASSRKLLKR